MGHIYIVDGVGGSNGHIVNDKRKTVQQLIVFMTVNVTIEEQCNS